MIEIKTSMDSRDYVDALILPMVIRKRKINNEIKFTGFVPGFEEDDVIENDLETCKTRLLEKTKAKVADMIKSDSPFPFFPNKEELLEDFDDIVNITFVKVPNTKNKRM